MNHLLIWEEIPENTKAYVLVPGRNDKLIELAKQSHGYVINAEDNEAINELNVLLSSIECDYDMQNGGKDQIPNGPFAAVYICGFAM